MELTWLRKINSPLPLLIGLMAGGLLLVGTATYLIVEAPGKEDRLNELTVPAKRENLAVEIQASGTVEPVFSVNLSPTEPGLLVDLRTEQGMAVKQGQTLAVMDNLELKAQLVQAEANFKQAIANLKEAETTIPAEIKQAQAQLIQAQARLFEAQQRLPLAHEQTETQLEYARQRLDLAQDRVKRYQELLEEGAITKDRFDEALDEKNNAQATLRETAKRFEQEVRTAPAELGELRAAVDEAQLLFNQKQQSAEAEIAQLKAAAASAQAQGEMLAVQYNKTFIKAPFDGIITQRYATPGAFVTPTTSASSTASATSTSILAIARGLEVIAKVPEIDLNQLQPGQAVKIEAEAYPNQTFEGKIRRIAPEAIIEENVTSFEVAIALVKGPAPSSSQIPAQLRSKMNVDVTFVGPEIANAVVVPTVAIVTQSGKTGVMTPDINQEPMFKPVTIGLTFEDKTQIIQGLSPDERVYINLPEKFRKQFQATS